MINRNTGHSVAPSSSVPTILKLSRAFFRNKRKMSVAFCGTFTLLIAGLIVFPRTYSSESQLFVRLGKESVSLDPTATMTEVVRVNESRESEINSELEILRSRVVLEDVVKQLGADYILSRVDEGRRSASSFTALKAASKWLSGDVSLQDQAIDRLENTITVSSPRRSNVLHLGCKARDPGQAQRILEVFLDAYMTRHTAANRTPGSHNFFAEQSDLLGHQLAQADQELRDAKNRNGIASIEGQRTNLEHQANIIEVATLENLRALAAANEKVAALKSMLSELPEQELAEESTVSSAAVDDMRNEFYKVQIQEKEFSSRFTGEHPRVIAARRQVEETNKILAAQQESRTQPTRKVNAVRQTVHIELTSTQASVAAAKAEALLLTQQHESVESKIRALNGEEVRLNELSRKAKLLEESYDTSTTSREHARINAALETQRISNVNVVQPPSFVTKPSAPNVKLALVMALVLATLASVLTALASEHFDQSLKSPEQIEEMLGIPVLFSVPRDVRGVFVQN
jgi:polysaccharide biosynthesis protein PslE